MMKVEDILELLKPLRGEQRISYSCECCGTSYEWYKDPKYGEYLRWNDVVDVLKRVDKPASP